MLLMRRRSGGGAAATRIRYVPDFPGSGNDAAYFDDDDHDTYALFAGSIDEYAVDMWNLGAGTAGDYTVSSVMFYYLHVEGAPGVPNIPHYPTSITFRLLAGGSVTKSDFSDAVATGLVVDTYPEYVVTISLGSTSSAGFSMDIDTFPIKRTAITEMHFYGSRVAERIAYTPTYAMPSAGAYQGLVNDGIRTKLTDPGGSGDPDNRAYLHQTAYDRSEAIVLTLPASYAVTKMRVWYAGTGSAGVFVPGSISAKIGGVSYFADLSTATIVGENNFSFLYYVDIDIPSIVTSLVYFGFTQTTIAVNNTTMFTEIELYGNPV
jgi:hypothetical protein